MNWELPNIILLENKNKITEQILKHSDTKDFKLTHVKSNEELIKKLNEFVFDLLIYIADSDNKKSNRHINNIRDTHPAMLTCLIGTVSMSKNIDCDFYFSKSDFKNEKSVKSCLNNILTVLTREKNYSNLSSMILHDLRSPVQSISGYLELLNQGVFGELNEGQNQIIRNASALSDKLIDLLEDLNKVYLFEINKFELEKTKFQLKELIEQSLRSIWIQSDQKNIKLIPNIDSNLPEIIADPNLLQRVIINLLSNAIKYCPEKGTVRIYIQLAGTATKVKMINFKITDTGPGIPLEDIQFIFNKFFRASGTKNRSGGLGLGLYISKLIIEAHDGQIGAYNNREGGSTFYFNIPASID